MSVLFAQCDEIDTLSQARTQAHAFIRTHARTQPCSATDEDRSTAYKHIVC